MITEKRILECFEHLFTPANQDEIKIGPGDDAAVIAANHFDLVHSVDIAHEGVHFPKDSLPEDIAYRATAIALSDLAAMGAYPKFFSIGLMADEVEISWYEQFANGLQKIIKEYNILLIGGDVTKGSKTVCVNVFGHPFNEVLKRSTANIGDKVFITGQLGKSRQGLKDWNSKRETSFVSNFFYPKPKFEFAKIISDHATSCIDISDGLYSDLNQICFSSKVGAKIFIEKIPITYDLNDLTFGDDYELCFTAPDNSTQYLAENGFYMIGEIDNSQKIEFYEANKKIDLKQKGWDPFA